MDLNSIDWKVVLEYAKALAGPVATLVGAIVVARLALSNFRRQKLIERRLDWYESVHRLLAQTGRAYVVAAHIRDERRSERENEATRVANELASIANEAWIYAEQKGFEAVQVLAERMARAHVESGQRGFTPQLAKSVSEACDAASNALALEARKELRIPMVHPREGVTKTIELPPPAPNER